MKRHQTLIPLSREHHFALLLAQLLKKGAPRYKGMPVDNEEKITYAVKMFEELLQHHFNKEEFLIAKIDNANDELVKVGREILEEHIQLTSLFQSLANADHPVQSMDRLGRLLEEHIRKEERILFPLIEKYCSDDLLQELEAVLSNEPQKKDLETTQDIEQLITHFYSKVKLSPAIGYIFTNIAKVDWDSHLPVINSFWENVLFHSGSYRGNPMKVHKHLHSIFPLTKEHFSEWIRLFGQSIDELFSGEKANLAKQRASGIATLMQIEIFKERPIEKKE